MDRKTPTCQDPRPAHFLLASPQTQPGWSHLQGLPDCPRGTLGNYGIPSTWKPILEAHFRDAFSQDSKHPSKREDLKSRERSPEIQMIRPRPCPLRSTRQSTAARGECSWAERSQRPLGTPLSPAPPQTIWGLWEIHHWARLIHYFFFFKSRVSIWKRSTGSFQNGKQGFKRISCRPLGTSPNLLGSVSSSIKWG